MFINIKLLHCDKNVKSGGGGVYILYVIYIIYIQIGGGGLTENEPVKVYHLFLEYPLPR